MKVERTAIPGVLVLEPKVFGDERGWFMEIFNRRGFREATGLEVDFVQDNVSRSQKNVLRGLHYQIHQAQGKLIRVLQGSIWDVAVDVRRGSPRFGAWVGLELSEDNRRQLWIPRGFAHGFCVLSDSADFFYKCTELYAPEAERAVRWNDPALGIRWPVEVPLLSAKDRDAPLLADASVLPAYPG